MRHKYIVKNRMGLYLTLLPTCGYSVYRIALYPIDSEYKRIVFDLDRDVIIGRTGTSNLILREECVFANDMISRNHAAFRRRGGRVYIVDLDSSNGTSVNGVPVKGEDFELKSGYIIRFGRSPYCASDSKLKDTPGSPPLHLYLIEAGDHFTGGNLLIE